MAIDIGLIAYVGFQEGLGRTYNDEMHKEWQSIGQFSQDAWRKCGVSVLKEKDRAEESARNGCVG